MNKNKTKDTRINIATTSISPQEPWNNRRQDEAREGNQLDVMLVLPPYDGILAQIADVRYTGLTTRLQNHPADMGVPKALVGVVRVEVGVGVPVMCPVTPGPPLD